MEKEAVKNHHQHNSTTAPRERHLQHHLNNNNATVVAEARAGGAGDNNNNNNNLISRSQSDTLQSSDLLLRWGNRKRLRCVKIQVKDEPFSKTTVRVDRRVVRCGETTTTTNNNSNNNNNNNSNIMNHGNHSSNGGHFNLRQRAASPAHLSAPTTQRVLRNSETAMAMKGHGNGGVRGITSPDRVQDHSYIKRGGAIYNHHGHDSIGSGRNGSVEPGQDNNSKKGGSSSGSDGMPVVWPPKFVIALTNKEKEEDFMAIKGSKLPQRPKKRAKIIQRTLNLVSPGGWLCDLTLERYEVREKKVSKKRPRGLKAMGNMDSDSD